MRSIVARKSLWIAVVIALPMLLLGGFLADGMGVFLGVPLASVLAFVIAFGLQRAFPQLHLGIVGVLTFLVVTVISSIAIMVVAMAVVSHVPHSDVITPR